MFRSIAKKLLTKSTFIHPKTQRQLSSKIKSDGEKNF